MAKKQQSKVRELKRKASRNKIKIDEDAAMDKMMSSKDMMKSEDKWKEHKELIEKFSQRKNIASEAHYPKEIRLTKEQMEEMKVDNKKRKSLSGKQWNEILNREIVSHEALEKCEEELMRIATDYNDREIAIEAMGLHHVRDPFIPEDLGFESKTVDDSIAYYKDNIAMSKVPGQRTVWRVIMNGGVNFNVDIPTMYHAVIILSSLRTV